MARALPSFERESLEDRFGIHGPIGVGQYARVFAAWDRRRDSMVALKTLHERDGESISRFKSEFRSLADVSHPNVVQLFDLISDGEIWLMTMELVDGIDLREFQKDASTEQLLSIYQGIARGLNAIHQSGHLHCDLRPANVRVDRRGRPVVLDFGFIARVRHASALREGRQAVLGSVAYAAPEVIRGGAPSPASDWYAFATMLFEALAGHPPFRASNVSQLMLRKASSGSPDMSPLGEHDRSLVALLRDLLARNASERPGFDAIMKALGSSHEDPAPGPRQIPFVGREDELESLRDAFDDVMVEARPHFVGITGASGIGKTRLARRFLNECREATRFVFESRCHENEHLPFLALDAVIEELSRLLAEFEIDEDRSFVAGDLSALVQVFPSFGQIPSIDESDDSRVSEDARQAAFESLAATLARMSELYPIVFFLDDVQWGDTDSAHFVGQLLQAGADSAQLLVVTACRSEDREGCPFSNMISSNPRTSDFVRTIELSPLGEKEQVRLAAELDYFPREARKVMAEARGNPFLLTELARHTAPEGNHPGTLDELYRLRLDRLSAAESEMVQVLSLLGRPAAVDELIYLFSEPANLQRVITRLKIERVVRVRKDQNRVYVETFHDRIRETILELMWWTERAALHTRIALGLEAYGEADPESLYHHFWMAGLPKKAGQYAFVAADQSVRVLAFDHAAKLLEAGLALSETNQVERMKRVVQIAECRSHMHRHEAAAASYLEASSIAAGTNEGLALRLRACEQFIQGGNLERGFSILHECLETIDATPPDSRAPLFSAIARRRSALELGRSKKEAGGDDSKDGMARLEISATATRLLSAFDIGAGLYLAVRSLEDALGSGKPAALAHALIAFATHEAIVAPSSELALDALDRAEELLGTTAQPTENHALYHLGRGVMLRENGDLLDSQAHFERAATIYDEGCIGARWQLSSVRLATMRNLAFMSRIEELNSLGEELEVESHASGDEVHSVGARLLSTTRWLAADRPDVARRRIRGLLEDWNFERAFNQRFRHTLAEMQIALYEGLHEDVVCIATDRMPHLRQSFLMRSPLNRIELHVSLGVAHIGLASKAPNLAERSVELQEARIYSSELRRERIEWSRAIADILDAQIAAISQSNRRSSTILRMAQNTFGRQGLTGYSWAAQWLQGVRMGGRPGQEATARVEAVMREEGIENPRRFISLFIAI